MLLEDHFGSCMENRLKRARIEAGKPVKRYLEELWRGAGGLEKVGNSGNRKSLLNLEFVLEVEQIALAEGLYV